MVKFTNLTMWLQNEKDGLSGNIIQELSRHGGIGTFTSVVQC